MSRLWLSLLLVAVLSLAGNIERADAACILCIDRHPGRDPGVHLRDFIPEREHRHDRDAGSLRGDTSSTAPEGEVVYTDRDRAILAGSEREDADGSAVCTVLRVLYLAEHAGEPTPRSLRHVHGCDRWAEDARYHWFN